MQCVVWIRLQHPQTCLLYSYGYQINIKKLKLIYLNRMQKCTHIAAKKVTVAEFFQCQRKKKRCEGENQRQQCSVGPCNLIIN